MRRRRSVADGHAHVAGGAFDDPHRGLNAGAVEIGKLGFGDLLELSSVDRSNIALGGLAGTFLDLGGLGVINTDAGGVLVMKVKLRSS